MAPDLNSVPPSPRPPQQNGQSNSNTLPDSRRASAAPSRRASQIYPMSPPPLPLASPGGSIPTSVQAGNHSHIHNIPFPPLSPPTGSSEMALPMRHPQPLTPAQMHLEMEKEQEAIVNRLTRELSALRAHSSSVASTTSVSSASTTHDPPHLSDSHAPVPHRSRHRSSSSMSASHRQPSVSGTIDDTVSTPSAAARTPSVSTAAGGPMMSTTPRYEEVLLDRERMEKALEENEKLKRRVRELEAIVRGRRASSVSNGNGSGGGNGRGSARGSMSAAASDRERSVSVRRGQLQMPGAFEGSIDAGGSG